MWGLSLVMSSSLHNTMNSIHPPQLKINTPKTVCGCPCSGVIKKKKIKKKCNTCNPPTLWNVFVNVFVTCIYTAGPPESSAEEQYNTNTTTCAQTKTASYKYMAKSITHIQNNTYTQTFFQAGKNKGLCTSEMKKWNALETVHYIYKPHHHSSFAANRSVLPLVDWLDSFYSHINLVPHQPG